MGTCAIKNDASSSVISVDTYHGKGFYFVNILHLLITYLPLTESWIYPQITGQNLWTSTVGAINRSDKNYYPFSNTYVFTDQWPIFKKGKIGNQLLSRFPQIAIYGFRRKFKQDSFNLLHCHFGHLGFYALPLRKHLQLPMVTMFYGQDATMLPAQHPVWRKRYLTLFKHGEVFLVEGNHMKRTLMELGCPEEKIKVFHLGVDVARIPSQTKNFQKGETLKLLAAGSFREKKGLPYAIEAFAMAQREYSNMTLTVIGDSTGSEAEEKEKEKIISIVSRYDTSDSITFLGFQPHERFIEELQNHHLFISPSIVAEDGDAEGGSPVAITEASAAGLPVISTFHCDIPEVVLQEKTGLLVKEKDVIGLKESILFFVNQHENISSFSQKSQQHIALEYNLSTQLTRLQNIYKNLLAAAQSI